jgi:hypothetical protein
VLERGRDSEPSGLWIPGFGEGEGQQQSSWVDDTMVNGINDLGYQPSVEQHQETHWVLKYPLELGGIFFKASYVSRPVSYDPGDSRPQYSLHVHRFTPYGLVDETGPLSREELVSLRSFLDTVIQASVS